MQKKKPKKSRKNSVSRRLRGSFFRDGLDDVRHPNGPTRGSIISGTPGATASGFPNRVEDGGETVPGKPAPTSLAVGFFWGTDWPKFRAQCLPLLVSVQEVPDLRPLILKAALYSITKQPHIPEIPEIHARAALAPLAQSSHLSLRAAQAQSSHPSARAAETPPAQSPHPSARAAAPPAQPPLHPHSQRNFRLFESRCCHAFL